MRQRLARLFRPAPLRDQDITRDHIHNAFEKLLQQPKEENAETYHSLVTRHIKSQIGDKSVRDIPYYATLKNLQSLQQMLDEQERRYAPDLCYKGLEEDSDDFIAITKVFEEIKSLRNRHHFSEIDFKVAQKEGFIPTFFRGLFDLGKFLAHSAILVLGGCLAYEMATWYVGCSLHDLLEDRNFGAGNRPGDGPKEKEHQALLLSLSPMVGAMVALKISDVIVGRWTHAIMCQERDQELAAQAERNALPAYGR